jgi:hypothetical protein
VPRAAARPDATVCHTRVDAIRFPAQC